MTEESKQQPEELPSEVKLFLPDLNGMSIPDLLRYFIILLSTERINVSFQTYWEGDILRFSLVSCRRVPALEEGAIEDVESGHSGEPLFHSKDLTPLWKNDLAR